MSYTGQTNGNETGTLHWTASGGEDTDLQLWILTTRCISVSYTGQSNGNGRVLYTELHLVCEDTDLELWILTTQCSSVSYTEQSNGNERVFYTELHLVERTQFWSFESSPPNAVQCHTQNSLMAMNGYLHWTASGGEYTVPELWILTTRCSLVSYTGQTNGNERVLYTELHRVVRTQFWELWILTTQCCSVSYTGQINGNKRVLYTELYLVVRTQFWRFESPPPDAFQCHTQDSLMAMYGYSTLNCIWWWGHSSGALNPHHTIQLSVIHRTVYWQWTVTLHWTASGGEDTVLELWILTTQCSLVSYTGQTNGNERVLYTELHRVVRTQFGSFESSPPDAV